MALVKLAENDSSGINIVTEAQKGRKFEIGSGFRATGFKHDAFEGRMDPFIMVDHYTMTESTFGAHPHAGLAAVSVIFEDSTGKFHNRDSLGNDFDLLPGDLYWLNAGSGVIHDEAPRDSSNIHGLQVFVNLPNNQKDQAPSSTLVRSSEIPVVANSLKRVRVVLGAFEGIENNAVPDANTTILDGKLFKSGHLQFKPETGFQTWLYVVSGELTVSSVLQCTSVHQSQAIAFDESHSSLLIENAHLDDTHFVIFSGKALREQFVQKGPLVQSNEESMHRAESRLKLGLFGKIA